MKVKDLKTDAVYELLSYKASAQRTPNASGEEVYLPKPTLDIDMSMRLDHVLYSVSYTKYFGSEIRFEITNDKGEVIYL